MPTIYAYTSYCKHDAMIHGGTRQLAAGAQQAVSKFLHKFPGCEWGGLTIESCQWFKTSLWYRPAAKVLHQRLQVGDVMMFWDISRCFTDIEHLIRICGDLDSMGVRCVLLDLGLTIGTQAGDAVFAVVKRILQLPAERRKMLQPVEV
jgi:DNA invertase Pin-like site-specific DNA recombinase